MKMLPLNISRFDTLEVFGGFAAGNSFGSGQHFRKLYTQRGSQLESDLDCRSTLVSLKQTNCRSVNPRLIGEVFICQPLRLTVVSDYLNQRGDNFTNMGIFHAGR